jgi:uncharacterized protein involved in exopolysaccharide biosynthesis
VKDSKLKEKEKEKTEEAGLDLFDFLRDIWKRRVLVAAVLLLFLVTGVALSLLLPKWYEASVTFIVEESKISGQAIIPYIKTYSRTYERIIKNNAIMKKCVEKFQLDKEPYNLSFRRLNKLIDVRNIRDSKLIELTVEMPKPELARDVAILIADKALELNSRISKTDTVTAKKFIKIQVDTAKEEMDEAERRLLEFQREAKIDILQKKIEILLTRKGTLEQGLADVLVAIAENKEHLTTSEEEFKKSERTFQLTRRLAEDVFLKEYLSNLSEMDSKKLFHLPLKVEVANPIYSHIEEKIVDLRPTLDGLNARQDHMQLELQRNTSELSTLLKDLIDKAMELQRRKISYDLAVSGYQTFVKKFQQVNLDIASKAQELKILDPALLPLRPTKPRKVLIILLSGMVGLMCSLFLALFMRYFEQDKYVNEKLRQRED